VGQDDLSLASAPLEAASEDMDRYREILRTTQDERLRRFLKQMTLDEFLQWEGYAASSDQSFSYTPNR
jgi:hypothetical protein